MASTLHQNLYEGWLSGDVVREYAEDVKQLVAELKRLLKAAHRGEAGAAELEARRAGAQPARAPDPRRRLPKGGKVVSS